MTDKSIAQVLRDAADLIEPEGAWSDREVAKDAAGDTVSSDNPEAVCWCALGAIWKLAREYGVKERPVVDMADKAAGMSIAAFNDDCHKTQAEVVAKLREAAALAEEQAL
jgi:hypothetical protein